MQAFVDKAAEEAVGPADARRPRGAAVPWARREHRLAAAEDVDADRLELLPQQRGGLLREGWRGLALIGGLALGDARVVVVPVAVSRFSDARVHLVSPAAAGAPRVGLAAAAAPSATVMPRHWRNGPRAHEVLLRPFFFLGFGTRFCYIYFVVVEKKSARGADGGGEALAVGGRVPMMGCTCTGDSKL